MKRYGHFVFYWILTPIPFIGFNVEKMCPSQYLCLKQRNLTKVMLLFGGHFAGDLRRERLLKYQIMGAGDISKEFHDWHFYQTGLRWRLPRNC